jgi:hypothetical protein
LGKSEKDVLVREQRMFPTPRFFGRAVHDALSRFANLAG